MIDHPHPTNWRELQAGVCRIFREIGLNAVAEKKLSTPRGEVEVDVYAVDESSVDKIQYIVECKNWQQAIPQTVVHAFTTVMHETGANLGFIVSQKGLQSGAVAYTDSTNIVGLTYLQLQERYMPVWWDRYFCPHLGDAADVLMDYVEPVNGTRDKKLDTMSDEDIDRWRDLVAKYGEFGATLSFFNMGRYQNLRENPGSMGTLLDVPSNIEEFRSRVLRVICRHHEFTSETFRELLDELKHVLAAAVQEFIDLFGENIFRDRRKPITVDNGKGTT
ncbi:restriction endonuclease [Malikia spinosa]|uniref:restriction endonuclease n=1 Tax=Malikia spinosa TaxID=86180 RepID=UPI0027BAE2BA|nr:restriction endonuclease [Malikia spinosa]